jgi:predicted Zn-dependent peptidase
MAELQSEGRIRFSEYDLANGLHVILHEVHTTPVVAVNIWYHVGSKNEEPRKAGFAHLFEHMMFQGSANIRKAEHFTYVYKAGGTLNASTSQDSTNYYEVVPSHHLELVIWLESDRMMSLNVSQENFDNQREVVKEERRFRYENRPYGTHWEEVFVRAFKIHPYRHTPIGTVEDLNAASLQDVQHFFSRFYTPSNAVLSIAGDINKRQAKRLVQKHFGGIPRGNGNRQSPSATEPPQVHPIHEVIFDNVQLPGVFMAFHVPAEGSPDFYPLELLSSILSSGKSSRLYQYLVYERRIAQSVNAFNYALEHPGLFYISSIVAPGHSPDEVRKAILGEIGKLRNDTVTGKELDKAKNQTETNIVHNRQTVLGTADELAHYFTFFGNTDEINNQLERYAQVTDMDIQRVAEKYLTSENSTTLYYLPKTEPANHDSNNQGDRTSDHRHDS